jgi:acetyl esterase
LAYERGIRLLDIAPEAAVILHDETIVAAPEASPIVVRHYQGPRPSPGTLLWLHGGGYCVGSLESADPVCRMLAVRSGMTVISVAYRLAPEAPFPAAVDDAFAAYEWLRTGIERDSPVVLGGDSAGATLALVTALLARDRSMQMPTALLLAYPTAAGRRPSESKARYAEGHFLELADLDWFYDNYTGPTDLDMDFRFAPLAATTLRGLPPTWIALAELDPLRDEGRGLANALRDAQVTTIETEYAGLVHGFLQMGGLVPAAARAHADALAFLTTSGNRWCDDPRGLIA